MYVMFSWSVNIYNVPKVHRLLMNHKATLNDLDEHNKGELILGLFLKVPTGPR